MDIVQNILSATTLTLTELERICGFPKSSMRKWSENIPSINKVAKVAEVLGVSLDRLYYGDNTIDEPPIDIGKDRTFNYSTFEEFYADYNSGRLAEYIEDKKFIFRGQGSDRPVKPSIFRDKYVRNDEGKLKRKVAPENKYMLEAYCKPFGENDLSGYIDMGYESAYRVSEHFILKEFYQSLKNMEIASDNLVKDEDNLLKEDTYEKAIDLINGDWVNGNCEELAALAQHCSIPTRLLDWSKDIWVALYFASKSGLKKLKNDDDKLVIWGLEYCPNKNNHQKEAWGVDSHSNIAKNLQLKFFEPANESNYNCKLQKGVLTYWKFINEDIMDRIIEGGSLFCNSYPRLIKAYNDNNKEKYAFFKITIPTKESVRMFDLLTKLGYTASNLFSEYEGAKLQVEETALLLNAKKKIENIQEIDESKYVILPLEHSNEKSNAENVPAPVVYAETPTEERFLAGFRRLTPEDRLIEIGRIEKAVEGYSGEEKKEEVS